MKILMSNLFLQGYTGSESYVYTLGKELRALGNEVHFYVHNWGWFGNQVVREGFTCYYNPNNKDYKLPYTDFDFVHFQHKETVEKIYAQVKHIPKLFICHGILPNPEQPLPFSSHPMEAYAGVSEETLKNVIDKARPDLKCSQFEIVRNLIDTERFSSTKSINKELKNVLIISNYFHRRPEYLKLVKEACRQLELNLEIIGDAGTRVPDTRPYIEKADLVIGLGRCAYEAMAMERNVLVFDYQGLEGLIASEDDYMIFRECNLSGRCRKNTKLTLSDVSNELKKYKQEYGKQNREYILQHHDSKVVAKQYLDFIKQI